MNKIIKGFYNNYTNKKEHHIKYEYDIENDKCFDNKKHYKC